MIVLGIETSCDETGVALYDADQGLLAHDIYSQTAIHMEFGGVVPELASRDQIRKTLPIIKGLLKKANLSLEDLGGIAYTAGPGLAGALLVGATVGRSLGWALDIPTVAVHHIEAHLHSAMLEDRRPEFPFLAFVVSGGHTLLARVAGLGEYELLGESIDDAAGEAFDKVARLLGFSYPGGPELARLADTGDPKRFDFPRPMTKKPGLNFSFSGLKTAALTRIRKSEGDEAARADIAAGFQEAVVDTLIIKCQRALKETGLERIIVGGGVSANRLFREKLQQLDADVFFPRHEFCTDNGAMVAYLGCQRLKRGEQDDLTISISPRTPLDQL